MFMSCSMKLPPPAMLPLTTRTWWLCSLLLVLIAHSDATESYAQTATLRGFITLQSNGEPLQGVNVVLRNTSGTLLGAATDGDGVYSIAGIPPGQYRLQASFIGFQTFVDTLAFRPNDIHILNIALSEGDAELEELIVEAEEETGAAKVTAGLQSIRAKDIDLVPAPDVSGDLMNYLTTLPGVVTLGDRGGQVYIRGGEPSHNMALLDGMYVHQPFHMLGFYSAFPSDIVNRVDLHAAGYGSPYSGRISSVLDVYSRNGNKRRLSGAFSLAPFVSAARLEGPIWRDRVSFIASARQSVIEYGAQQYVKQDLPYNFGDIFGKVHYRINENHQLSISAITTHDRGALGEASEDQLDEVRWENMAIGARYLVLPKRVPFVAEVLLSFSRLRTELGPKAAPVRASEFDGFNYAVNMTNFFRNGAWKWGLFWRAPEITSLLGGVFQNIEFGFSRRHKAGAYIEPDFYITDNLHMRIGVIGQLFPGQDRGAFVEPRFRLVWTKNRHEISAAAGLYHQEVFGLNDRRDATSIFTAWRSAPIDDLSQAIHALAGYRITATSWLEMSFEGYYKNLSNLYVAEWTAFPRFTTRLQPADGRVWGLDTRIEIRRPSFYTSITYGLSSVLYEAKQAQIELWYGTESLRFRPPHDRRHQLNILFTTTLRGFNLSTRWNFGSGRPYNRVYGFDGFVYMHGVEDLFEVRDEQRVIYERPFQGELPAYHRLDLSVDRRFSFDGYSLILQAGVINLYNRKNLFALDTFTQRRTNQLPRIWTLGFKFEF